MKAFFSGMRSGSGSGGEEGPKYTAEMFLMGLLAIFIGFTLLTSVSNRGKEISFQEFVNKFLERGEVERIRVINKTTAYVVTRPGYSNADYSGAGGQQHGEYYFNIGSIEAFERRMEDIQRDIGIEPRDYVPIQYVTESNIGGEFIRALPSLIFFSLIFMYFRSMASGGGAGGV
eukprot:943800-Amorphochlora_amoeboformis.AAC.1